MTAPVVLGRCTLYVHVPIYNMSNIATLSHLVKSPYFRLVCVTSHIQRMADWQEFTSLHKMRPE